MDTSSAASAYRAATSTIPIPAIHTLFTTRLPCSRRRNRRVPRRRAHRVWLLTDVKAAGLDGRAERVPPGLEAEAERAPGERTGPRAAHPVRGEAAVPG